MATITSKYSAHYNAKSMARTLNGNPFDDVISTPLEAVAKADGLVVMYPAPNDTVDIRGAIHETLMRKRFIEATIAVIDSKYVFDEYLPIARRMNDDRKSCWTVPCDITHATFDIIGHDGKTETGIVFDVGHGSWMIGGIR